MLVALLPLSNISSLFLVAPHSQHAPWEGFLKLFKVVTESDVLWDSFTLHRIYKAERLMRSGNLWPIDGPPNTSRLSLREKKNRVKQLKDETDAIGTNYQKRTTAAVSGVYRRVCLLTFPPTISSKPRFSSGSGSRSVHPSLAVVVGHEKEDMLGS